MSIYARASTRPCVCAGTALALVLVVGCGKEPAIRRYEEVVIRTPTAPAPARGGWPEAAGPDAATSLTWETPEGWQAEAGAGMRVASFKVGGGDQQADGSIVSLGGDAGGLAANVTRWMGQLGIDPPAGAAMDAFLSKQVRFQTAGGHTGRLIDLTGFAPVGETDAVMLAGLIERTPQTVFVKLMGPRATVAGERVRFRELCESIR